MMTPEKFLGILPRSGSRQTRKLGTVDNNYLGGRPKIIFDGESEASTKAYPYLSSYSPAAGDRVALLLFGKTWVVIGKVI